MAQGAQVMAELTNESENVTDEFICVKEEPIDKEVCNKRELKQREGQALKPEVVYLDELLSVTVEAKCETKLGVEHEVDLQSTSLPGNGPVLTQTDISQILNNSDYEDDSCNEDPDSRPRVQEDETDVEDSSSDEEECDAETEEKNRKKNEATCVGNPANEDTHRSGYWTDRSTGCLASNSWHRSRFKQTKPNVLYPASLLDTTGSTDVSQYFNEYLDEEFFERIVQNTNQTARHNGKPLDFTTDECKIFFGIIVTMSCINYPNIRMYWNRKWAIDLIARAMARDRFMLLRHSIKLVFDDDIIEEVRASDQLWKVRPIINRVLEGCHRQKRHQDLSINELIIPLSGNCPIKQYNPDKPNPTGIKILALANPNGLICDFVTYQGENNSAEEMILHLTRTLVSGHILYLSKYFTTVELAQELNRNGIKCVGALMKSRLPKEAKCKLQSDKVLARQGRGSHDVLVSSDEEVAITKWFDNRPMLFLSTIYATEPGGYCIRYDRKRSRLRVPRPEVVREYDTNMGAVSLSERLLASCPSKMKTNKWTLPFMFHFIDLAVCNSWIQYKNAMQTQKVSVHKIYKLWEFKRLVGEFLIESSLDSEGKLERNDDDSYEYSVNKRGRPPVVTIPSKVMRTRGNEHLPQMKTVGRCRKDGCDKKTMVSCITCKLNLCLTRNRNCFKQFHTEMS